MYSFVLGCFCFCFFTQHIFELHVVAYTCITSLFIHSPVDGHLDCVHFGSIMSMATMDISI